MLPQKLRVQLPHLPLNYGVKLHEQLPVHAELPQERLRNGAQAQERGHRDALQVRDAHVREALLQEPQQLRLREVRHPLDDAVHGPLQDGRVDLPAGRP